MTQPTLRTQRWRAASSDSGAVTASKSVEVWALDVEGEGGSSSAMPSAEKGCIRGMGESGPPWVFGAPGRRVLLVSDVLPPCPGDEEAASVPREDVEACRERGKAAESCTGLLPPMPIEGIAIVDAAEKAARSPPPLLSCLACSPNSLSFERAEADRGERGGPPSVPAAGRSDGGPASSSRSFVSFVVLDFLLLPFDLELRVPVTSASPCGTSSLDLPFESV